MKLNVLVLSCLILAIPCTGETITVDDDGPADFNDIQDAIYYSWHGDTIIVEPGIYKEDISYGGRAITVQSRNPNDPNIVKTTIINGTVGFDLAEQTDSVLSGFTIRSADFLLFAESSTQSDPAISDGIVVWRDYRNGNYDIYGKNLTTGEELEICVAAGDQSSPAIYDDIVVWHDSRNTDDDIYGKNLTTGEELAICTEAGDQRNPVIYDDIVVWQDNRNGGFDIYGKNLTTGEEFAISTEAGGQEFPAIHHDIVVWYDDRNSDADIYGKNLTTGEEFAICTEAGFQSNPAIYDDVVVWRDNRNGNYDIYGKNLTTGEELEICTEAGHQRSPAIYDDIVVWYDDRNGNYDIYGKNLTTGEELAICTEAGDQRSPAIYDDVVVWQDDRNGNYDIYWQDIGSPLFVGRDVATGIFCVSARPTISKNLIFGCGYAGISGHQNNSQPSITDNVIKYCGAGIIRCDGAIVDNVIGTNVNGIVESTGTILRNTIDGNSNDGLMNCSGTISGNVITRNTIGINEAEGQSIISNNIIAMNREDGVSSSGGELRNNTVVRNGNNGIYMFQGVVRNNIIAHNSDYGIVGFDPYSYNCFWENGQYPIGQPGIGNVRVDPLFADADNGDYHLKSANGRWDASVGGWVLDSVTSRCIDSGDPADDIRQELNPNGARINIGAYGGTLEASKSTNGDGPEPKPECVNRPSKDYNDDCKVDLADFSEFLTEWLACGFDIQEACWQ